MIYAALIFIAALGWMIYQGLKSKREYLLQRCYLAEREINDYLKKELMSISTRHSPTQAQPRTQVQEPEDKPDLTKGLQGVRQGRGYNN